MKWNMSAHTRAFRTGNGGSRTRQSTRQSTRPEEQKESPVVMHVIKALLLAYVITGGLLILLAVLLYRYQLSEQIVAVSLILVYVASTFGGGFVLGKITKHKKYIWGMVLGTLYIALLFIITLGVYRTINNENLVTTLILCILGGTIGGMLS